MATELPGPKLSFMHNMQDIFEDIAPIDCGACSKIIDINDAYASSVLAPGALICQKCWREENAHLEVLAEIESIEYAMGEGQIGKREGKKRIKELKSRIKL